MTGDINQLLTIIADAEKHLSTIAKCKVKVSVTFEPDEIFARGLIGYSRPEQNDREILIKLICMHFHIPSILVHSKLTVHAQARWAFSIIARKHMGLTLAQIGDFLMRDHTTIIHGITRGQELMGLSRDPFAKIMKKIED